MKHKHMNHRTVIITGANSGIGKAATHKFVKEGHKVIMACRDLDRSRKVQNEIREATKNDNIFLEELDMSSFRSIRKFCTTFKNQYQKLDILIHNAAYVNHGESYRLSPDGIELTFATNVFGPYLMTMLLNSLLAESDDPRVLHAGSNIIKHFFNPKKEIDFDNLRGEQKDNKSHSVYIAYRNSKMALLMLTFKMAEVFKQDGIKVNSLQINGAKMSKETLANFKPYWRLIAHIQNLFFPSPDVMAGLYYEICTSSAFKKVSGKQFNHKLEIMQPAQDGLGFFPQMKQVVGAEVYPTYADRADISDKVWALCEELTNKFNSADV